LGLDISLLETFTLVADLESFSGAARRQGLTQPAISFQIKSLEKELGAPLIDRSRGKVVLTPAGRTAYRHARKILAARDQMIADIPRTTGKVAGQLLMCASTVPGEYLLPSIISDFRAIYPEVAISLDISDSGGVVERLKSETVELGFVGVHARSTEITEKRFADDRLVLVVPPGHRLTRAKKVTCRSLVGEPFVARKPSSGTRIRWETTLADKGIAADDLNVVAELGSTQAVISAVQSGLGVSMVSLKAVEQPARQGSVVIIDVDGADLAREFYVIYLKKRPLSVAAESFLKFCLH
jgi:DNA-binding transcriptional LysR family regulator